MTKLEQSQKAQEETCQHLMHGEQEIDALRQEGIGDKIAEKLKVTTEESGELRNRGS